MRLYREPFYDRSIYEGSVADIAAAIEREILDGVDGTGIQPGIIGEIGTELHYISPAEERVFRAVARVQSALGSASPRIPPAARSGSPSSTFWRRRMSTCDGSSSVTATRTRTRSFTRRSPDRGAYVQLDNVRGDAEWDTRNKVQWVRRLVDARYEDQVLLSQDVYMKPMLAAYGGTGYGYILTDFVPRLLAAGMSREQVQLLLVDNPRRALTGERTAREL